MDEKKAGALAGALLDVERADMKRARASAEYSESLEMALEAGATYVDLAGLLGVSRQAVRQYVERRRLP